MPLGPIFSRRGRDGAVPVPLLRPVADQTAARRRPSGRGDWVLCQITSNPYADTRAVLLKSHDFAVGSLKLFTANISLIASEIGTLTPPAFERVLRAVIGLLQPTI